MKSVDIVVLVLVGNHELSDFLERNVVCLTPLVEKSSSPDT